MGELSSAASDGVTASRATWRGANAWWAVAAVVAGTLIRLPQLGHSLTGDYAFRQTQTAFGVQEFARRGVDLLHSPLPVFGTASDVPLEFPLFQAFARLLMYAGPDAATASRIAGLVGFQAAAVLWWLILRRWRGMALATTSLAVFEVLPYGLHWGAASLIDFFSVALGLAMVLGFDVWLRSTTWSRWVGWSASAVFAWALFVVKVTSVPGICLLLVVSTVLAAMDLGWRPVRSRALLGLATGPALGIVLLALWSRHADGIKNQQAATDFLTTSSLWEWNFGGSRLDARGWHTIGEWSSGIAGPLALTVVLGVALGLIAGDPRSRILTLGLLASTLAPVLIFFNLFVVHAYYQIAVYPFLVTMGAIGAVTLWEIGRRRATILVALPASFVVLWLASTMLSSIGRHDFTQFTDETPPPPQVAELEAVTPPGSQVVAVGCDWDPQIFFFADRTGLMMRQSTPDKAPAIWRQNRIADYLYLVTCDQTVSATDFLPSGAQLRPTTQPDVFALDPPQSVDQDPSG